MREPRLAMPGGVLICLLSNPRRDTLAEAEARHAYPASCAASPFGFALDSVYLIDICPPAVRPKRR